MDEDLLAGAATDSLAALTAVSDGYLSEVAAGLYTTVPDAVLLAELRERETLLRRQAIADHALLAELEHRGIAGRLAMPSVKALLQVMLLLSPAEAGRRVAAAAACGPRLTLTGQSEPPLCPLVAAGQAAGSVSVEQARVIVRVLHELPSTLAAQDVEAAEQSLVEAATTLRPLQLGQLGQRIHAYLQPDGALDRDAEQQRLRTLALIPEIDGSYTLRGRLTGTCGALLQAWLSPHAAPSPAEGAVPDVRTYGQRMHDALQDLAGFAVRRSELSDSGAPAQVIITMTADQFEQRRGWAETSFGQQMTVDSALRLADEAALTLLVQQANRAVLDQGRVKRIATRAQSLALIARDRGCSFPGCDKPPEWTQRHHVIAWADGGTTDLANLTLVCAPHHRTFEQLGWRCQMRDQLPWWTPPPWIDPEQKPRQNNRIQRR
jgi:hypothetical protein